MRQITDQQWAAARAISEGLPGTHERLAGAMGVHTTTVSHRAAEDKWDSVDYRHARVRRQQAQVVELSRRIKAGEELDAVDWEAERAGEGFGAEAPQDEPEPWPDEPAAERIARIGAVLTRHTEKILRRVEAGLPLESRQVAALERLVALSERIAAMAGEEARPQQQYSDEEIAAALKRINQRIIDLATYHGRELAIRVFGISQEEVDEKLPEPEWKLPEPPVEDEQASAEEGEG